MLIFSIPPSKVCLFCSCRHSSFFSSNICIYCLGFHINIQLECECVNEQVAQSCPTLRDPMDCPWNSPGQNTGLSSLSLLQGIFPTQGSHPGLLYCRRILYQLSHKGSPTLNLVFQKQTNLKIW